MPKSKKEVGNKNNNTKRSRAIALIKNYESDDYNFNLKKNEKNCQNNVV
jgi:hypothetical protein